MYSKSKKITGLIVVMVIVALLFLLTGCSPVYEISTAAEPAEGGKTTGEGTYRTGETAFLTAEAAAGYRFVKWKSEGETVSTASENEFTVEQEAHLVAVFEKIADSEEAPDNDEEEQCSDNIFGEVIFKFPMSPVLLTPAPGGMYLYYYLPSDPADLYHILCMDRLEHQPLPTPGIEDGQIASINYSLNGEKIVYYALSPGVVEEEKKARIYFGSPAPPLEVEHSFALGSAEVISDNDSNHHRKNYSSNPVWKSNREGIYYFTTGGLQAYSLEDRVSRQLLSRSDLQGLFQGDRLSPHAFQISEQNDLLAYLDQEEELIIVDLEGDIEQPETAVVIQAEDTEVLEYIFDGKYLAMHSERLALVYGGGNLLLYNPETSELVRLEDMLYSYAYNEEHQLLVLTDRSYDSGRMLKLYDEDLSLVKSVNVPGNFSEVFWLGDQWGALLFDTLYSLDF